MSRIRITPSAVHPRQLLTTRGYVPVPQHPPEEFQAGQWLVKGHLVPSLVDPQETEVAVLPDFAIFVAIDDKGGIAGSCKLLFVGVIHGEGNGFATEPIADVVGVAVEESDPHGGVEDHLQIFDEIWIGKVARHLEGIAHVVVRLRVVKVYTESVLNVGFVEKIIEVSGRSRIIVRMTNIIHASVTEHVVRFLDVGAALISGLRAVELANFGGAIDLTASIHLSKATNEWHVASELHVFIDGLVDELDTVAVVLGEFGVVWCLGIEVEESITDTKGIENELCPIRRPISNHFILFVEIIIESWAVMTSIRFSPEIERFSSQSQLGIQLGKISQEALEDVPSRNGREIRCIKLGSVDNGPSPGHPKRGVFRLPSEWVQAARF